VRIARRGTLLIVAVVLAAATVTAAGMAMLAGGDETPRPGWIRAGSANEIASRRVTFVGEIPAYVVTTTEGPIALYARSPHLGEPVRFCASSGWFEDDRHGTMFDGLGRYELGPAPRGLDRLALHVVAGDVWIDPANISIGPPRGVHSLHPSGPFCRASAS
jgi:hypothetical protein